MSQIPRVISNKEGIIVIDVRSRGFVMPFSDALNFQASTIDLMHFNNVCY